MTTFPVPDYLESDLAPIVGRGVGTLFRDGIPRIVPESIAVTVLAKAAHDAYQLGRHEAVRELLTADQAAAILGLHRNRVRVLARSRGVGWQVGRGVWLFRPEDVEQLRIRRPGNPHLRRRAG